MGFLEDLFSGEVPEPLKEFQKKLDEIVNRRSYRLVNGKAEPCSFMEAAYAFEHDDRKIDLTHISDECDVSTVFLGIDHNYDGGTPILFETMVFGGDWDGRTYRYATHSEAKNGHWQIVDCLRAGHEPIADGQRGFMDMFLEAMKEGRMQTLMEKMLDKFRDNPDKKLTPGNMVILLDKFGTEEEIVKAFDLLERRGLIEVTINRDVKEGRISK